MDKIATDITANGHKREYTKPRTETGNAVDIIHVRYNTREKEQGIQYSIIEL